MILTLWWIAFFVTTCYASRRNQNEVNSATTPSANLILTAGAGGGIYAATRAHSPFDQHLPSCKEGSFKRLKKITRDKALLCPMFKDEEGFLSEWIAYYQMHGFDHIFLFNDGSTDNSLVEVQPWLDAGFVTVRTNWTTTSLNVTPNILRNEFKTAMCVKALLERECKLWALKMGYKYYASLDLDEYVIPLRADRTIVDELQVWFEDTERSTCSMEKFNFQQAPHTLEPVNLLTIEAYQTRMKDPKKMNYYTTVAPKFAYMLQGSPRHSNMSGEFIATCCHFHGCQGHDFIADSKFCSNNFKNEAWVLNKGRKWYEGFKINHYSRSLEKYAIKGRTWKTSTGEVKEGETGEQVARSYDIPKFLQRSTGWYFDDVALRYSCQLREALANMTGERPYLRPGTMWYRNAEFGKHVSDPDKRGRYGRPNPEGYKFSDGNPYLYRGQHAYVRR